MDVRVLRYFLAVAREQTISGAAEVLHMTQPPLSKQLRELEEELGTQLFYRGKRRITLTKEGMLLRKRAEEIVSLVEKTKAEVSASDEQITGDIHIGGGETESMRPIAQAVEQVQQRHPGICVHFFSGDGYDVAERLDRGLIDFGTLIEPVEVGKYDSLRLPRPDVWGLLLRWDHPLARQAVVRPEDLADLPLIVSRQMVGENGLSGWLGYDYEKLHIVSTGNLVNNLILLVEEGVGCALTLDGVVKAAGDRLCFRPLAPRLESWMYLVWKKYQIFSPAAEAFLHQVRASLSAGPLSQGNGREKTMGFTKLSRQLDGMACGRQGNRAKPFGDPGQENGLGRRADAQQLEFQVQPGIPNQDEVPPAPFPVRAAGRGWDHVLDETTLHGQSAVASFFFMLLFLISPDKQQSRASSGCPALLLRCLVPNF